MGEGQVRRALIVEDHDVSREVLRRLLRACGWEAEGVDTVAGAEPRLASVDRVFLDLQLKDGNGCRLLRLIRERDLPIKVAITTGSADGVLMEEIGSLRPDAVFIKPVRFNELLEWLRAE